MVSPNEEAFEIEEDLFKCGVCAYTSRFKQNVRRHERRHLTESDAPAEVEDSRISILCDTMRKTF